MPKYLRLLFYLLLGCGSGACAQGLSLALPTGEYKLYDNSAALIIGASRYNRAQGWDVLTYVPTEIDKVKSALEAQGFDTKVVLNPDYETLSKSIRSFFTKRWARDTRLLIYFAGHGQSDISENMGYILPVDAVSPNDPQFMDLALSMAEIRSWLPAGTRAKHVMLVFDSCFGGMVFRTRNNLMPPDEVTINQFDRPVWQYLTAGRENQTVPDDNKFSDRLIDGLGGNADKNGDGIITATELGFYVSTTPGLTVDPQFGNDREPTRSIGDMIFLPMKPTPISEKIASSEQNGPRVVRQATIGVPVETSAAVFSGVEILYYQKAADVDRIYKILNEHSVPNFRIWDTNPDVGGFTTLACGPDSSMPALKQIARHLIEGKIEIRRVMSFKNPGEKLSRIELLGQTDDGGGKITSPPLTLAQIESLDKCPTMLQN